MELKGDKLTRKFLCLKCGHNWEVPFGGGRQLICPKCGGMTISRTNPGERPWCCSGSRKKKCRRGEPE
ncbi:MAG: hypothetical protein ACYDHG_02305 [Desulfomonilaceae bacterium]